MNSTSADFQNLYQALSRSAARSPDALALAFEDRRYLYRDFHLRVQRAMAKWCLSARSLSRPKARRW